MSEIGYLTVTMIPGITSRREAEMGKERKPIQGA
jgi:hypothetical protein